MTTRDKVFYFWGVMDVIGIAWYIMGPLSSLENMWASAAGNLAVVILFFASAGPLPVPCRSPGGAVLSGLYHYTIYVFYLGMAFLQEKRGCHQICPGSGSAAFFDVPLFNCALPLTCREVRDCRRLDEYLCADPV